MDMDICIYIYNTDHHIVYSKNFGKKFEMDGDDGRIFFLIIHLYLNDDIGELSDTVLCTYLPLLYIGVCFKRALQHDFLIDAFFQYVLVADHCPISPGHA